MLWQTLERFHIAGNDAGCPVVVFHDGVDAVANAVVCLTYPYVQREEEMDDGENEEVQLIAKKTPYAECGSGNRNLGLSVVSRWWEIRLLQCQQEHRGGVVRKRTFNSLSRSSAVISLPLALSSFRYTLVSLVLRGIAAEALEEYAMSRDENTVSLKNR